MKGVYYGFKYQCVEFARRWLTHVQGPLTMPHFKTLSLLLCVLRAGITFGDVGMAYEIYDIPHASRVTNGSAVKWTAHPNGSTSRPVAGSVILWNEGGEFQWTGHVAIATEVSDAYLRVAEQNVEDVSWGGRVIAPLFLFHKPQLFLLIDS